LPGVAGQLPGVAVQLLGIARRLPGVARSPGRLRSPLWCGSLRGVRSRQHEATSGGELRAGDRRPGPGSLAKTPNVAEQ
jgi:hypothetical protein